MSMIKNVPACLIVLIVATFMSSDEACAQFRWRGRPLPETRHFLITESGLYIGNVGYELFLKGDLGFMTNVSRSSAWGGSLHSAVGGEIAVTEGTTDCVSFGVSGRYRHWFNRDWSLDLAPRMQWVKYNDYIEEWSAPSLGLTAAISLGDLIGLALSFDSYEELNSMFSISLRLGSYLGAPGAALLSVFGMQEL